MWQRSSVAVHGYVTSPKQLTIMPSYCTLAVSRSLSSHSPRWQRVSWVAVVLLRCLSLTATQREDREQIHCRFPGTTPWEEERERDTHIHTQRWEMKTSSYIRRQAGDLKLCELPYLMKRTPRSSRKPNSTAEEHRGWIKNKETKLKLWTQIMIGGDRGHIVCPFTTMELPCYSDLSKNHTRRVPVLIEQDETTVIRSLFSVWFLGVECWRTVCCAGLKGCKECFHASNENKFLVLFGKVAVHTSQTLTYWNLNSFSGTSYFSPNTCTDKVLTYTKEKTWRTENPVSQQDSAE